MSKAYESAGVNLQAGYEGVKRIKKHVESTKREGAMGAFGGFGGMFDLSSLNYKEPVLISGTDGVGTKLLLAQELGKHDTIGIDAVAMCVNDIVVQGAEPIIFLDYLALGENDPNVVEEIVSGIAEGCRQSGAALVGGETAEMPGLYKPDEYDVAGFAVGVAEKSQIIDINNVKEGNVLIGLPSSGVHSNGFSLVRKIISDKELSWSDPYEGTDKTLGEVLLTPTKIYVNTLKKFFGTGLVNGAAHITGGGIVENVPRMLPEGLGGEIFLGAWEIPSVFAFLAEKGALTQDDLYETFNMGIGLIIAVEREKEAEVLGMLKEEGETPYVIGRVVAGSDLSFLKEEK